MLVQTMYLPAFLAAFREAGRADSFTRTGLGALHGYLWNLAEDIGEPIEVDPIGLCGSFAELTFSEFEDEAGREVSDDLIGEDVDGLRVIAILASTVLVEFY